VVSSAGWKIVFSGDTEGIDEKCLQPNRNRRDFIPNIYVINIV